MGVNLVVNYLLQLSDEKPNNFDRAIFNTIPARSDLIWLSSYREDLSVNAHALRRREDDGRQVMAKACMSIGQMT